MTGVQTCALPISVQERRATLARVIRLYGPGGVSAQVNGAPVRLPVMDDTVPDGVTAPDGDVLDGDLLLASAPVVVEPLCQHHDRPRRLVGELKVFCSGLEIIRWLCPALLIHRQRGLVRRHQLRIARSIFPRRGGDEFVATVDETRLGSP